MKKQPTIVEINLNKAVEYLDKIKTASDWSIKLDNAEKSDPDVRGKQIAACDYIFTKLRKIQDILNQFYGNQDFETFTYELPFTISNSAEPILSIWKNEMKITLPVPNDITTVIPVSDHLLDPTSFVDKYDKDLVAQFIHGMFDEDERVLEQITVMVNILLDRKLGFIKRQNDVKSETKEKIDQIYKTYKGMNLV